MQDLIRHLPAVIYEYAFYPDGNHRFHYLSENCDSVLGVGSSHLSQDVFVLRDSVVPDDLPKLEKIFSPGERPLNGPTTTQLRFRHPPRKIEFRYSDHQQSNGVVLRRGIGFEVDNPDTSGDHTLTYEELFEKLPIGVVIHYQGIIEFANSHAHCIVRAKRPGELVGQRALNFVHSEY